MRATSILFVGLVVGCSGDIGEPGGNPDGAPELPDGAEPPPPDAAPPDAPFIPARCGDGDVSFLDPDTGHCYLWIDEELLRDQAQASCQQVFGGFLATITSAEEDAAVARVAPDVAPVADDSRSFDSWLGGNDLADENVWAWDSGEPFVFLNFRDGEPNNSDANDPNGEDCMIYEGDTDSWDDRSCTTRAHRYICEREPQ